MAIRTEAIQCSHEIATDPNLKAWRTEAAERGYCSSIALPFRVSEDQMACLTAYADKPNNWSQSEKDLMQDVAEDLGFGLKGLRTEVAKNQYQQDLRATLLETIEVIAETVDQRDPYTAGHEKRVTELALAIAAELGLDQAATDGLRLAGLMHDIGKLTVPAEILNKPTLLTPIEFELIKGHVAAADEILRPIDFEYAVAEIVVQHHERLDGSGYPAGLRGDEILPEARILAVADVVEAMASHRPYRPALGIEAALAEIRAGAGTRFEAEAVAACERLFARGFAFEE